LDKLIVVIPALNEALTLRNLVASLLADYPEISVLVVDDASEDDTATEALSAGAGLLSLSVRLGPWGATQAGVRRACDLGFEYALSMDADGQHLPGTITQLIEAMNESDADIVIGSAPCRGSALRNLAWKMMRVVSGLEITDLTSGFRLYNKRAMNLVANERASYLQYQDIGVLALVLEHKMRVVEAAVEMAPRQQGVSRIFNSWLAVVVYMLHTLLLGLSKRSRYRSAMNALHGDAQ